MEAASERRPRRADAAMEEVKETTLVVSGEEGVEGIWIVGFRRGRGEGNGGMMEGGMRVEETIRAADSELDLLEKGSRKLVDIRPLRG